MFCNSTTLSFCKQSPDGRKGDARLTLSQDYFSKSHKIWLAGGCSQWARTPRVRALTIWGFRFRSPLRYGLRNQKPDVQPQVYILEDVVLETLPNNISQHGSLCLSICFLFLVLWEPAVNMETGVWSLSRVDDSSCSALPIIVAW